MCSLSVSSSLFLESNHDSLAQIETPSLRANFNELIESDTSTCTCSVLHLNVFLKQFDKKTFKNLDIKETVKCKIFRCNVFQQDVLIYMYK